MIAGVTELIDRLLRAVISQLGLMPGVTVSSPPGASGAWPTMPTVTSADSGRAVWMKIAGAGSAKITGGSGLYEETS